LFGARDWKVTIGDPNPVYVQLDGTGVPVVKKETLGQCLLSESRQTV
jgi:hypothetical protein